MSDKKITTNYIVVTKFSNMELFKYYKIKIIFTFIFIYNKDYINFFEYIQQ